MKLISILPDPCCASSNFSVSVSVPAWESNVVIYQVSEKNNLKYSNVHAKLDLQRTIRPILLPSVLIKPATVLASDFKINKIIDFT